MTEMITNDSGKQMIDDLQQSLLRQHIQYVYSQSAYYKRLFDKHDIDWRKVRSVEDLKKIPVTTKQDLHEFNADFLCIPHGQVADFVTTSGTAGNPVLFALSEKDLERLAYNESLSYECAGLSSDDIVQLTTTIDRRFMAGLAYYLGARKMGMGVVRVGSGVPELQWDTIVRVKPTVLICVPSFLLKMLDYAAEHGIEYRQTSVKKAICIGEPLRTPDFQLNTLAKRIAERWDIQLYSTYASTEMATAFTECEHGQGGHRQPDLIITEFLDENDQPVQEGEPGELVVTTLGVEAMPLLRFKTGDIVQPHYEPCACGRTTMRLGPVIGRKNQMIKYKGTTLYPPAMLDILNDFEEIGGYLIELASDDTGEDIIVVKVGTGVPSATLHAKIKDRFRAKLRVSPEVVFESVTEINKLKFPENSRKSVEFIDKRTKNSV